MKNCLIQSYKQEKINYQSLKKENSNGSLPNTVIQARKIKLAELKIRKTQREVCLLQSYAVS